MTKKKAPRPVTRGRWEATMRNIRAMKKKLTKLDRRIQRLERKR